MIPRSRIADDSFAYRHSYQGFPSSQKLTRDSWINSKQQPSIPIENHLEYEYGRGALQVNVISRSCVSNSAKRTQCEPNVIIVPTQSLFLISPSSHNGMIPYFYAIAGLACLGYTVVNFVDEYTTIKNQEQFEIEFLKTEAKFLEERRGKTYMP